VVGPVTASVVDQEGEEREEAGSHRRREGRRGQEWETEGEDKCGKVNLVNTKSQVLRGTLGDSRRPELLRMTKGHRHRSTVVKR